MCLLIFAIGYPYIYYLSSYLTINYTEKVCFILIGLVIVSHSSLIANGTRELALQMADPSLKITAAGGTPDGKLGTDMKKIRAAIEKVNNPDGVLILTDLGSSVLTTEMVIEMMEEDDEDVSKIKIANAPLVEGAVVAAVEASCGNDIIHVKKTIEAIVIKKVSE